jgi:50S ribosomal protein L16 3-hydroxylase
MIKAQLQTLLDDDTLVADFAGSYLSKTKCALDLQALDEPMLAQECVQLLMQQTLTRTGGLRCFYTDETVAQGVCYVEGERYALGAACQDVVIALCNTENLSHKQLKVGLQTPAFVAQLTEWVNAGFWYFED